MIFLAFLKLKHKIFFIPRILASSGKKQSSARVQWRVLSNCLAKGQVMEVCQRASQVNPISIVTIKAVKVKTVIFFKSKVMLHQLQLIIDRNVSGYFKNFCAALGNFQVCHAVAFNY